MEIFSSFILKLDSLQILENNCRLFVPNTADVSLAKHSKSSSKTLIALEWLLELESAKKFIYMREITFAKYLVAFAAVRVN